MSEIETLSVLVAMLTAAAGLAWVERSPISPPLVFLAPFTVAYAVYYWFLEPGYQLEPATNAIMAMGAFAFAAGSFGTSAFLRSLRLPAASGNPDARPLHKIALFLLAGGGVGFILGLAKSVRLALSGTGDFFYNLRIAAIQTNTWSMDPGVYLILLLHVGLIILVIVPLPDRRANGLLLLSGIAMLVASSFFTVSRGAMLLYATSMVVAYILARFGRGGRTVRWSLIVLAGMAAGVLLGILALLREGLVPGGQSFVVSYMGQPFIAFDRFILRAGESADGYGLLYPFWRVAEKLHIAEPPAVDLGLVKDDFNVFTTLWAPYLDFGAEGVVLFMGGLGLLYAVLYHGARRGDLFCMTYYSVLVYPLMMSFFDYHYRFLHWMYYGIAFAGCILLSKRLSSAGHSTNAVEDKNEAVQHQGDKRKKDALRTELAEGK